MERPLLTDEERLLDEELELPRVTELLRLEVRLLPELTLVPRLLLPRLLDDTLPEVPDGRLVELPPLTVPLGRPAVVPPSDE